MDCRECEGRGTVYGRYKGIAGCETPEYECKDCHGSGVHACDNCGKPSRDKDQYCSDSCEKACEG